MAFIEFKCEKCGYETEELVKSDGKYPACPKCGGVLQQKYSGKCGFGKPVSGGGCGGHCESCEGCR